MRKQSFFLYIMLPALNQIIVMLSDLLILVVIAVCLYEWGIFGFIMAYILVIIPTRSVGGFFFSWKQKNIFSFWKNWFKIMESGNEI